VTGLVPNEEWKLKVRGEKWYQGDTVNLGIGQGDLLVTPVQVAYLAATIANRGELVDLRMVKSAQKVRPVDAREDSDIRSRQVSGLTPLDWERMAEAMKDVVHLGGQGYGNNGTAWAYIGQNIPYRMAGKSGTAQVVEISQGEAYDEDTLSEFERKHAWFMAFAPTHDPKIALAVLVENGGGGSSVAGPIARKVIDSYLVTDLYADKREQPARFQSGPADLL
jgi:penicillin-binding protein 2